MAKLKRHRNASRCQTLTPTQKFNLDRALTNTPFHIPSFTFSLTTECFRRARRKRPGHQHGGRGDQRQPRQPDPLLQRADANRPAAAHRRHPPHVDDQRAAALPAPLRHPLLLRLLPVQERGGQGDDGGHPLAQRAGHQRHHHGPNPMHRPVQPE